MLYSLAGAISVPAAASNPVVKRVKTQEGPLARIFTNYALHLQQVNYVVAYLKAYEPRSKHE